MVVSKARRGWDAKVAQSENKQARVPHLIHLSLCLCLLFGLLLAPLTANAAPATHTSPPLRLAAPTSGPTGPISLEHLSTRRWLTQITSEPMQDGKASPPMEWPLILLEFFSGGIVAGFGSVLLQSLIDISTGLNVEGRNLTKEELAQELATAATIRGVVVFTVIPWAVALTVWGIGTRSNNYTGNYWWALLGAYAGQLLSLGSGLLLNALDTTETKEVSRIISFLLDGFLTAFGSILLYNLLRKPFKGIQQIGSLMRYDKGQWQVGIPLPMVSANRQQGVTVFAPVLSGQF